MSTRRQAQVADFLREEISDIMRRELNDPRLGMASITRVEMSPDLRYARVFVSVLGTQEEQQESLRGLQHAAGFIRHLLKPRMHIRHIPEIVFKEDHSLEHAEEIARTLRSLHLEPEPSVPELSGESAGVDERD
jgi:ribosome-binding factor A